MRARRALGLRNAGRRGSSNAQTTLRRAAAFERGVTRGSSRSAAARPRAAAAPPTSEAPLSLLRSRPPYPRARGGGGRPPVRGRLCERARARIWWAEDAGRPNTAAWPGPLGPAARGLRQFQPAPRRDGPARAGGGADRRWRAGGFQVGSGPVAGTGGRGRVDGVSRDSRRPSGGPGAAMRGHIGGTAGLSEAAPRRAGSPGRRREGPGADGPVRRPGPGGGPPRKPPGEGVGGL